MNTSVNLPNIRFRGILKIFTPEKPIKTTQFELVMWGGSKEYAQMLHDFYTRKNGLTFYYKPTISKKVNAPEMVLECKGSQNLSGLHQWFEYGRLSGYAYGFPENKEFVGGKTTKRNGFFPYREDAFLFRCTPSLDPNDTIPTEIEWIVLEGKGAYKQARAYRTMLIQGGFDSLLATLPMQDYRAEDFSNI